MKAFYIFLTVLVVFGTLHAQESRDFPEFTDVKKVAQTGYQFLKIGAGARGASMGGASITVAEGASSIFWNPAGMASVEKRSVFVDYTQWFADMKHQAVAAAVNLGNFGVIGVHALSLDNGSIQGTAISNSNLGYDDTGNLSVTEMSVGLSYAKQFNDRFAAGVTVKYCTQDLIEEQSSVMAFDIGTLYNTGWHDVKIAVSVQHFSKEIKYIDENFVLPLTYRVGFSADILSLTGFSSADHKCVVAVEGVNPRDYSERVHLGAEYRFRNFVAIRSGYKFNYDVEGISFGAGIQTMGMVFDYSYSDFGAVLGNISRFSVQLNI